MNFNNDLEADLLITATEMISPPSQSIFAMTYYSYYVREFQNMSRGNWHRGASH